MAMKSHQLFFLVGLFAATVVLPEQQAHATNLYFLPGDCFFHSRLTATSLKRIEKQKTPVFFYDRPKFQPSYFCGYGGYRQLHFKSMPAAFKRNLKRTYEELRRTRPGKFKTVKGPQAVWVDGGRKELLAGESIKIEQNGFNILFYNSSFNFQKFSLGVKYNENWTKEAYHGQYENFVKSAKSIMQEWRDSKLVPPLAAKIPPRKGKRGPQTEAPLLVEKGIRAIVLPVEDFEGYFAHDDELFFYEVTDHGIYKYSSKNGKWKQAGMLSSNATDKLR